LLGGAGGQQVAGSASMMLVMVMPTLSPVQLLHFGNNVVAQNHLAYLQQALAKAASSAVYLEVENVIERLIETVQDQAVILFGQEPSAWPALVHGRDRLVIVMLPGSSAEADATMAAAENYVSAASNGDYVAVLTGFQHSHADGLHKATRRSALLDANSYTWSPNNASCASVSCIDYAGNNPHSYWVVFTFPIWMGLLCSFFGVIILALGVSMIMSIQTPQRYDDPKGKPVELGPA
jgi:hypothetical protein